jgi:hypothetical protein
MGEHCNQNAGVYVSGPRKPIAWSRFVAGAFRNRRNRHSLPTPSLYEPREAGPEVEINGR